MLTPPLFISSCTTHGALASPFTRPHVISNRPFTTSPTPATSTNHQRCRQQPELSAALPHRRPRLLPPASTPLSLSFSPRPFRRPSSSNVLSQTKSTNNTKNSFLLNIGRFKLNISPSHAILCLVPCLWASFVICAKLLYILPVALPPATFNSLRLLVSCLFFSPILFSEIRQLLRNPRAYWPHVMPGIQIGILVFCGNILQICGLKYAPAARSAFINQLSTIFVPLVAAAFSIEPLTKRIAAGAFTALFGIFLLTAPIRQHSLPIPPANASTAQVLKSSTTPTKQENKRPSALGDGLQLSSAAFTTAYVLRVSHFASRLPTSRYLPLSAIKVGTQTGISLVWLLGSNVWNHHHEHQQQQLTSTASMSPSCFLETSTSVTKKVHWTSEAIIMNSLLVLWAGVMVSAVSAWLQTKGQAGVSAGEAAVLFASQPVWASVFAFAMLRERMQAAGVVGAMLVVGGAIMASTGKKEEDNGNEDEQVVAAAGVSR